MLSVAVSTVIVIAAVILVLLLVLFLRLREKSGRKVFLKTRAQMSDADFLAALNVGPEHHARCLAVRQAVAKIIEVPPESVHASEPLPNFMKLGFTLVDFFLTIEDELSAEIDVDTICEVVVGSVDVDVSSFADFIRFFLDHPEFIKGSGQSPAFMSTDTTE